MIRLCILLLLLQHFCSVHSRQIDNYYDDGDEGGIDRGEDEIDQIVAATQQHNGPKECKYYESNITSEFICSLLCRYSLSTVLEMVSRNMPNWSVRLLL